MKLPLNPALAFRKLAGIAFPGYDFDETAWRKAADYCEECEPTPRELNLLISAKGGASTIFGTVVHTEFEAMAEQGWVKEVTLIPDGVEWRLSGRGLVFAYSNRGENSASG